MFLVGLFGFFIVVGIIIFAAYRGSSKDAVEVVVWGTIPKNTFDRAIDSTSLKDNELIKVNYVEKNKDSFDSEFIEALASGNGPDLFMLPSEKIFTHRNKIFAIPYNVFTERQFRDSFIEGAEIYMAPEGILAFPVYADPLVMYWNRSIFTEVLETEPPKYWDEFYRLASLISKKDGALNIQRSAVSMGEFSNITNAKEIVLNLAMQAGTPVTVWSSEKPASVFSYNFDKPIVPAEAALNFYTEFSNPSKTSYSWNRSLPSSIDYFISGDLSIYFGFASEIGSIQFKNPNLNFDVAKMPSSREGGSDVSYARYYGFAITKASQNANSAFSVASVLSSKEGAKAISEAIKLPSLRRDLLKEKQNDSYLSVFYESVIKSKSWLDPSPALSNSIFKNMIESITSGRERVSGAVNKANQELNALFGK